MANYRDVWMEVCDDSAAANRIIVDTNGNSLRARVESNSTTIVTLEGVLPSSPTGVYKWMVQFTDGAQYLTVNGSDIDSDTVAWSGFNAPLFEVYKGCDRNGSSQINGHMEALEHSNELPSESRLTMTAI